LLQKLLLDKGALSFPVSVGQGLTMYTALY
jgi:hypothetical protein